MRVLKLNSWDSDFFRRFSAFHNDLHKGIITSFPESDADYAKYFGPDSLFVADFNWTAFQVLDGDTILAQAILCSKKGSTLGNLGFIDFLNCEPAALALATEVFAHAKGLGLKTIKTPVDLNFFVKYRIRVPGGEAPVWGEPVYPDYYHELFRAAGFVVVGNWDSYRPNRIQGILDFFKKRRRQSLNPAKRQKQNVSIRSIRMKEWEKELGIIYDLFSKAYSAMPEYEDISFEQFRAIYDDFKYIMQPWLSYIVELDGVPVAFSINYVDPLPILAKRKGMKLGPLARAWTFLRLRLNAGTMTIAHVGKIPAPNGEEVHGVQVKVSNRLTWHSLYMRKVVVTFQNVNSPSRRAWDPKVMKPFASYVLFGKEL